MKLRPTPAIHLSFLLGFLLATWMNAGRASARDLVTDPRVEYLSNPIGVDVARPRFFWVMQSLRRGARQSAYRMLVASTTAALGKDQADVWDSGKVISTANAQIEYSGPALRSRTRYHFKVMLWDDTDRKLVSRPAFFETGFMDPAEWRARFIGLRPAADDERQPLVGAQWIGAAGAGPTSKRLGFRAAFTLAPEEKLAQADLFVLGAGDLRNWMPQNKTRAWLNDTALPSFAADHKDPRQVDLTAAIKPGANRLVLLSPFVEGQYFVAMIRLRFADGRLRSIPSDASWQARAFADLAVGKDYPEAAVTDPAFRPARVWGAFGADLAAAAAPGSPAAANRAYLGVDHLVPAAYLRTAFAIDQRVIRARLYATAAGVYELRLNGARVGTDVLAPGWTDYRKRIRYQSYDVTAQVRRGANVLGGIVGDGWYAGRTGVGQHLWGYEKALAAELHLTLADGSERVVATDRSWKGATGPIRKSDMLDGEQYDARRELPGWDAPGYDDRAWRPVSAPPVQVGSLQAQTEPAIRITRTLGSKTISRRGAGVQIVDLGQNMVGWVRLRVAAPRGTRIKLRYGEVLNLDGSLFTANLRSAIATDEYIAKGQTGEVFEPHFTVHGFRYVEVAGLTRTLGPGDLVGQVINNDLRETGVFSTSSRLLNQLQSNIVWGQRGNFISVPTDCPQRDERLGWTGDIQMFARTGLYNMEAVTFLTKYLLDLEDTQAPDGSVANIAPTIAEIGGGAYGWGDALVILPELLYQMYGDRRVIERHFPAMKKWVDFRTAQAKDYLNSEGSFGDWLAPEKTPDKILSPIFHAHAATLLARMARVIGKTEDAALYEDLASKIRRAWNAAYAKPDGSIESDTQTAYVLALRYEMLPPAIRPAALARLQAAITRADNHLATGFLGTGHLLPALSESGSVARAYELLLTESYPSWLFSVNNGATTIWERWDSYSPTTGPSAKGGMNSYNHYAFGAVGEWMYGNIAGIDLDRAATTPGFAQVVIRPVPGGGITHARGSYRSIGGTIATSWRLSGGRFLLDVEIPVHATAVIHVPAAGAATRILESGRAAATSPGLTSLGFAKGAARFAVGAGHYRFSAPQP